MTDLGSARIPANEISLAFPRLHLLRQPLKCTYWLAEIIRIAGDVTAKPPRVLRIEGIKYKRIHTNVKSMGLAGPRSGRTLRSGRHFNYHV